MLDAIGLTDTEQATYLALLDESPATVVDLRDRIPGETVPLALASLEGKGLVSRLAGRPVRYQPAPPDVALEVLVRSAERELQQVRLTAKSLMERYHSRQMAIRPEEIVEVVTSADAVLQRWRQVQRAAVEQVRVFDRPPYGGGPTNVAEEEALARGIRYRTVYDPSGLDLPGRLAAAQAFATQGEEARVASDIPVKMFIADNSLGLISLGPTSSDSALVIHSSSLLDTLIALFEAIWMTAVPVRFEDGLMESGDPTRSPSDRQLLSLLAAGLTDEAIGRHLGWHPRTVQRHLREIMSDLGAQTRFQAGLQAARRGWL